MQDIRERILEAAARVYTEAGFRGTTTRRVAQQADVNEVTLFRHFGTKDALLKEALAQVHDPDTLPPLGDPVAPREELDRWAWKLYERWYAGRHLIARVMGDLNEHPQIAPSLCDEPRNEHGVLTAYLERLRTSGLARSDFRPEASAGLLLGAIFTHAMLRDHFGEHLPPAREVIREYVALVLTSLGCGERGRGTPA